MLADTMLELKPRGVMELFDQAIRLYRNNFLKFVGIIAVAQVPLQVVQMVLNFFIFEGLFSSGSASSIDPSVGLAGSMASNGIIVFLSYIFVSGLATAALTRAITDRYMGEEISVFGAYARIGGIWGRLLAALFLLGLAGIPLFIWSMVPCIGWLTGFGMMFFLTLVIAPLIAPVVVIEARGSGSALRRGWELARHRFWWLTGFFLLLALFNLLVVQGPVYVVTYTVAIALADLSSAAGSLTAGALQTVVTSLLTLLLSLLYLPLASTCATLAYFDLRVRQEGLDLALMAAEPAAGQDLRPPAGTDGLLGLAGLAPLIPAGPLITWKEMGYFALISLILAAMYTLLYSVILVFILALSAASGGL